MQISGALQRLRWLAGVVNLPGGMRWRRLLGFTAILLLSVVVMGGDVLNLSPTRRATASSSFSLEEWVTRNLMGKALGGLFDFLPGRGHSEEEREAALHTYFELGEQVRRIEGTLALSVARGGIGGEGNPEAAALEERLGELRGQRDNLGDMVEATLEQAVADVLREQGLGRNWGPFEPLFPPVSFRLERLPKLIVVSPRDHIATVEVHLLESDLSVSERVALEAAVGPDQGMSALVTGLGGLATFPSLVSDSQPLRYSLQTMAHEWLHQYFFFHALGQSYYDSADMTTLNETAADLGGKELGDFVYVALGGEIPKPVDAAQAPIDSDRFDFNKTMRETRKRTDELLAADMLDQAEAYMEERRMIFVENGYPIRLLNQAYFAFHGTYAENAASISPVAGQLRRVRDDSANVGQFIQRVRGFDDYQSFLRYVDSLP
jgi:hypothetical protein